MPRAHAISSFADGLTDQLYSPLLERARASGRPVQPLHIGDTFRGPFEGARVEALSSTAHPDMYMYAPVQGELALREAFAEHLAHTRGVHWRADDVQVTAGATSGIAIAVHTLLDAGDEVLLPAPFWPLVRGVITSRGAVAVEIPFFDRVEDPTFDVEAAFEKHVTPRTAAIYLNSPNNPTGASISREQLDAIARVAHRHELWVISDEAYQDLAWDGVPPAPFDHPKLRERCLTLHTLSKSHGLAGARIGFLNGPERIMRALRGMQMHLAYCAPRPMQHAAVAALREGSAWVEETRRLYRDAAQRTAGAFGVAPPRAGTFLFLDASRWLDPSEPDCSSFLRACADRGVLLTPGSVSGRDYARWVRVCFTAVGSDDLRAALEALNDVIRAH